MEGASLSDGSSADLNQQNQQIERDQYNIQGAGTIGIVGPVYQNAPVEINYPVSNLPIPNPHFIGRSIHLEALADTPNGSTTITQTISGLGGIGKSQLMLQFAHKNKQSYDILWWLRVDEALAEDYIGLGRQLGLPVNVLEQVAGMQLVRSWLNTTPKRWLLLCDNADEIEPNQLSTQLPASNKGRILITSRNPDWHGMAEVIQIDVFTPDEAENFWTEKLGNKNEPERLELAKELGFLPLALEHAAGYIATNELDVATYLHLYRTQRQELWQEAEPPVGYHEATISTTWEISFQKAKETVGAAELLNLCCFLAPDDIPLNLLVGKTESLPSPLDAVLTNTLTLNKVLKVLRRLSLIERKEGLLKIHRLVQTVARDRMKRKMRQKWLEVAVDTLCAAYHFDKYDMKTWIAAGKLIPHLTAVTDLAVQMGKSTSSLASLNDEVGTYLVQFGSLTEAKTYFERALNIRKKIFGKNHTDTAKSLNNIGRLLQDTSDLYSAKSYYEEALAIRKNSFGLEHKDTATSLNNLGLLLRALGDLSSGMAYVEQALNIRKRVLGLDHPDTASSLNNLGSILQDMGELAAARPYIEDGLETRKRILGPDHPDTASSLNNLGSLLQDMGDFHAAKKNYEKSLAIRKRVFGNDHLDTSISLNNFGILLVEMGDLDGAKPYIEQALNIRKKSLGSNHPATALTLNNMGLLLKNKGDFDAARHYYEQALGIYENVLDPDHPNIAQNMNNLGILLRAMGDLASAKLYFEQALEIREKILGPKHPNTAQSNLWWGIVLKDEGWHDQAQRYLQRALDIFLETFGPDHSNTKIVLRYLE